MPYDPNKHHRRSIRLPGYDYASAGMYFVTLCTHIRTPWFGTIQDGSMHLNDAGRMVEQMLHDLPIRFPHATLDTLIVMPDHVHVLFALADVPLAAKQPATSRTNGTAAGSIGRIVQAFKSLSTVMYTRGVTQHGWELFPKKLWQRDYYERIVRSERELNNVRAYICTNPTR